MIRGGPVVDIGALIARLRGAYDVPENEKADMNSAADIIEFYLGIVGVISPGENFEDVRKRLRHPLDPSANHR